MTKTRFSGFPGGSTVTIGALKGGVARGPITVSWGQASAPGWDGSAITETLTVTAEEVFPGGRNFSPVGVEFHITVTGSSVGTKPDIFSNDGVYNSQVDPTPIDETGFRAYDPTYQGIQYVLHTGDSGNYANTRVGHASHRNKAFQYGQNPGHVYSVTRAEFEAQTDTSRKVFTGRSIYAYDATGAWGRVDLPDLVVKNPDDDFDVRNVIVVSNDPGETWADAPPHDAFNRFTNLSDAMDRVLELRSIDANGDDQDQNIDPLGNGVRVSVKQGTTYAEIANAPNVAFARGRLLFDTWDQSGTCKIDERNADPTVSSSRAFFSSGTNFIWPFAVKGWHFDLGFDVNTGGPATGDWTNGLRGRELYSRDDTFFSTFTGDGTDTFDIVGMRIVWDNVKVEGCAYTIFSVNNETFVSRRSAWFFNECEFTKNNDYVIFQASNLFFLGTVGIEEYGNELGGMGRNRTSGSQRGFRGHRNVRESTCWMIYMRACFWESKGGWSGQNSGETDYSAQPLFRLHEKSNPTGMPGKRYYFCDSVILGPFGFDLDDPNRGRAHAVLENCMIVHDPMTVNSEVISYFFGRQSIRNCVFLTLDTPFLRDTTDAPLGQRDVSRFEVNPSTMNMGAFTRFVSLRVMPATENTLAEMVHNTFVMLRPASEVFGTYEPYNTLVLSSDTARTDAEFGWHPDLFTGDDIFTVAGNTPDWQVGHNVFSTPKLASTGTAVETVAVDPSVRVLDMWMKTVWERQVFALAAPLADGATTSEIPYPVDWYNNATTQASYAGSNGNHAVRTSNVIDYAQVPGNAESAIPNGGTDRLTVNFGATGFTITNRSGATWPAGETVVLLDRGSTSMDADLLHEVDQTEVALYRPVTPQSLDAGVSTTMFDFARNLRPNAGYAISPSSGTNVAGALLHA